MISIRSLSFSYPKSDIPALSDIDWQVDSGEFVLVGGPSGSGKSTLLRCLNGLVPHFSGGTLSGDIAVDDKNVVIAGPHVLSRHVGFVAQDPESQAVLDLVEGEVAFALENAGVPPAEMRIRVEEAMDLVGLAALRNRAIHTLSGGERQRLAIAAALAFRPRMLVLDEPTSQLDPQSAEDVLRALVRLNEDLGLTIILAEHRLERILRYVDRLTWLEMGRIVTDGPVREVLTHIHAGPPLVQLARALNWKPLPLTVKEGMQFALGITQQSHTTEPPEVTDNHASELLTINGLRFAYNGRQTLKNINLTIGAGEAVALVGRNGAGKSTLLRCIVGLLKAQSGDIYVRGRSTRDLSVAEICLDVGYLPQNPDDLLFSESVAEELALTLRNHGLDASKWDPAVLLDRLGLAGLDGHYPRDLSVGQRQRVAMGAVTITKPRLLLLDEPTRGLDGTLKMELVTLWRQWLNEGSSILLVTHDVELAAMIASRTVMLSQGEIIASGSTREVLGSSPHFAPQIARLFPGTGWLTVADALAGLENTRME